MTLATFMLGELGSSIFPIGEASRNKRIVLGNEPSAGDCSGKRRHTCNRRQGLVLHRNAAMATYRTTGSETSVSPPISDQTRVGESERHKVGVPCLQSPA